MMLGLQQQQASGYSHNSAKQQQQFPLQTSTGASMDERSLKEIIEVLNRQIGGTSSLAEFSQVLQIQNISMLCSL
jgi:hypothetical protein